MSLPFLTDFRRAETAFNLLFAFMRDDACEENDFESATCDLLRGARLPEAIRARLKVVYDRVQAEPDQFEAHAAAVAAEFAGEREVLYSLVSIMLRLTTDDGMLCRRDSERIQAALRLFSLTSQEFERFSPAERALVEYFLFGKPYNPRAGSDILDDELQGPYSVLGCNPDSSDSDVRSAYRRLVMKFHPDRQRATEPSPQTRRQFEAVQSAYEQITKARKSARAQS